MERIRNARRKRQQQLKRWYHYDKSIEKDIQKKHKKGLPVSPVGGRKTLIKCVQFSQGVILLEAAARGDLDEARMLLSRGVCPNVTNTDGLTALHQCCIDDNQEMCRLLLRFGADVNARDTELWTPLHAAATCCHTDLCKLLIDNGADLLAVNADGNMPYDICEDDTTLDLIESEMASRGITQEDIDEKRRVPEREMMSAMETLIKSGGDLNQLGEQGAAPLHIAAACGYLDVACFLLQHGAALDLQDRDGWSAIHIAACWGQFEIIEILTSFGANLDSPTACGETVFEICEDDKMRERLVLLKEELKRRQTQHNEQQQNWPNKTRGLVRRRSSNPRSASIRRSSMREKAKLSWKEARLEAETCSLVVPTEDGSCVQEEAKAPVWMTSATIDGAAVQRKTNGEQHSVADVNAGNNGRVRSNSVRLSTSRSQQQQPPPNCSPLRGVGAGRLSETQRPTSPSETSPNTSSKKSRTGPRSAAVDGTAMQPLPERPTPAWPSRSRSPPYASWNGSNKAGPNPLPRDHSARRPKASDSNLTSDHISRRHPTSPPLLENNSRNNSSVTATHTGAPRTPGPETPGTIGLTFNHKSSSMKEPRSSVNNGTSNSALLQHNAYYSPLEQQLRQSPPSSKWRSPPLSSSTMDRRDSRNWSASKNPCQPQVLFSTGTEPTGGIVANPLLTPGSSLTRPPPKRELISRPSFRDQDQLSGKCCVIM
ncbi:hypothetical protein SprV_0301251500 [Sparganum proliferum]